jgi:hypothetical protein
MTTVAAPRSSGSRSDPRSPRSLRAGAALIAAGPILFAAIVLRPERADEASQMFAAVADARSLELISSALFVLGAALLAVGAVAAGVVARSRGGRLAWVGSLLLAAGSAWFVVRAYSGVSLYAFTDPALPAEARELYLQIGEGGAYAVMLPLLLAFIPAPIVLGLGLRRLGIVPTASVATYAVGLLVFLALETDRVGEAIGFGLMAAGLSWYGIALARTRLDAAT